MADQNTIFISYARKDSSFVMRLTKDLQDAGVEVWLDKTSIDPGQEWDAAIEEAMETSGSLLIVLSRNSVGSRNVMDEVSYALEEDKRVLPVLYRPCKVPFRLRRVQHSDFTTSYNQGKAELLEVLKKPFESPKPVPAWLKSLRRVPNKVWVGLVAFLILVGAMVLLWNFSGQVVDLKGDKIVWEGNKEGLLVQVNNLEEEKKGLLGEIDTLQGEKQFLKDSLTTLNQSIQYWITVFKTPLDLNEPFLALLGRLQTFRTSVYHNSINPKYPDDAKKRQANQLILELLDRLGKDVSNARRGDPEATQTALIKYNGENNIVRDNHLFLEATEIAMRNEWRSIANISDSSQQHP